MELWDLYTKYRECTGKKHIRGEEIPEGYFHLCVHVWIKNSKGEYLISKRAANRPTFPLLWECVGGSVIRGETSLEGAIREAKEEVGIDLQPDQGKVVFSKIRETIDGQASRDIMDVWLFHYDSEKSPLEELKNATTDEVADCRWMKTEEIKELFDTGQMVYLMDYFFCAFEKPEPDYSSIIGKTVSGKIDRPLGSRHPRHPDLYYPVNYGYVSGVFGGDGKEQDIYLLGEDRPAEEFIGKVIAVFHRFNDTEDKWIVAADGAQFSDEQILGEIAFQEQFFYGKLYR